VTILFWCGVASATTYYVSNAGADAAGCTTPATACKTLAYVDGSITLHAGDTVLLQRGGVWNEQLIPATSGSSGSPIVYDAYGTGAAPVITAAAPILPWTGGTGTPWIYVSGSTWKASIVTAIGSGTVNMVQFGALYGRKQPYGSGCASSIVSKYDWCLSWPWLYVYAGNSSTNPVSTYGSDGSIVPIVAQASGLAMISIVGQTWLTFQHIEVQNFDYMGVSVTGASDHLVFANMEVDGMVPYGATPLGFYVNATNPGDIQFLNDDADLNYSGFTFAGTATAISVKNCRGYANRAAGLSDNTGAATYSYSHFYGNNVAELLATDVVGGIAGSGNVGLVCGAAAVLPAGMCLSTVAPVAVNFKTYPARFSFTVDDVGSSSAPPGTEAYINTFLPMFTSRGLYFNAAVVPSYSVDWVSVNNWYAAGNEIDSHSWSHQYYSTQTNPQNVTPYPNYPALDMQYTGSGTAATLTIGGSPLTLSTSVTGASGDSISPALNLTVSPYNTMVGLYTYLASVPHYSVTYDNGGTVVSQDGIGPVVRPNTHTANLLNVPGLDIKSASFKLVYDQTKLEPDEMAWSKTTIQNNVPGLTETFYVYPAGIEDPTIEPYAVAAGYTAARGSLSMKDQTNQTAGANSLYSNGVNVQNITSLAAVQIHGLTQGQISQMAASLVFRAAAWGAPYGFFTHWNSRGDTTPDISNTELGYLLDAITANGGVWLTNTGLASAVSSPLSSPPAIAISGTTRYIQNPTGAAVNLAVAGANSPTVARGVATAYPIDLRGTNRSSLGAWDVGASAYLSQRYGAGGGTGTTRIGGLPAQGAVQLPQNWVNANERVGTTSHTISFPATGTGGGWTCGATNYGPYTAGSQASLQQAINDAESCRTANGSGTAINIPAGALYSAGPGLTLPQTSGDVSSNFIVLNSTTPLPAGQTVCAHGIQDNVSASTQPGMRNPGCNGTNVSYQLGTTVTTVSGAFTLANGTATNTSAYNDIASMYTIEYTGSGQSALSTAAPDGNGIAPHHYAILNGEFRPQAGLTSAGNIIQFGTGPETALSQLPQHIHLAYSYIHGDWADAPVSGGVATGTAVGANSISSDIVTGCVQCSVMYNYGDKSLRPNTEGHFVFTNLGSQLKFAHNWFEGQSIGNFSGGYSSAIAIPNYFPAQDVEDRGNRYTYPYSWLLAAGASIIRAIQEHGTGTGSGYVVNDVITVVQTGASGGTGTVTSVGSGGTITGVSVSGAGTGYAIANNLAVTGGSGTGGTVDILTGYFPNNGTGGFARKNCHESKVGARVLIDGNICENVDFTGAQGILLSAKTDNMSTGMAGVSGNYGFQTVDFTITHNVFRNSCNGSHIMAGSGASAGNGGGIAYHPQRFDVEQNLTYGISVTNPGCGSLLQSGPQKGWTLATVFYTWSGVTLTENSAGTAATASLPTVSGQYESDIVPGDLVQISACTGTTAFNTVATAPGLVAIAGTIPTGLTVVVSNAGMGVPANASDNTCTLTAGQGYPANLIFNHNTEIIAGIEATNVGASPYLTLTQTTPSALAANISFQNSIFVGGGFYSSSLGEGTIMATQGFNSGNLNFNNSALPTRDQYVSCAGHSPGVGGAAACYTEWGGTYSGMAPHTLYFPYNSCSTGNDPTLTGTSANMGILGGMNISGCTAGTQTTFPYVLGDWHQYRLCHTTDSACNSKASLYAAGQSYQASDGSDLGVAIPAIDTAETRNIYPCASACGSTGPYADH